MKSKGRFKLDSSNSCDSKDLLQEELFTNNHSLFHLEIVLVIRNDLNVIQKMGFVDLFYLLIFLCQKNLMFYFVK